MTRRPNQTPEQTRLLALLRHPRGKTAADRAHDRRTIQQVFDAGVDLRFTTREQGHCPLEVARKAGHIEAMVMLLAHPQAEKPQTPKARFEFLRRVVAENDLCILAELVEQHGFELKDPEPLAPATLMHDAATRINQPGPVLRWLAHQGLSPNPDASTLAPPLERAVSADNPAHTTMEAVQTLIDLGAHVNATCSSPLHDGGTVLHALAKRRADETTAALWIVLLRAGADPRKPDRLGRTPVDLLKVGEETDYRTWKSISQIGLAARQEWAASPWRKHIEDMVILHETLNALPSAGPTRKIRI